MIQDLLGAIASSQAYRRFTTQKAARTVLYLFFISLLFTIGASVALRLRLGPMIDETFAWLEAQTPTLTFAGGKVVSSAATAVRLAHPKAPEVALLIDTERIAPVQAQDMHEAKVLAYLTGNALYIEERRGELRSYDLSKAGLERPLIVDSKFFQEAAPALKTVTYPIAVAAIFVFAVCWVAMAGLMYALLGMIINSIAGGTLAFGALYQIAIHAQTAALLLRIVMAYLPFSIPLSGLLTIMITAVYLWLGVRANAADPATEA